MNQNDKNLNNLMDTLSKRLGTDSEQLKANAQSGNIGQLLSKMDSNQAAQLQNVLSDEDAAKKLLSTPQAKLLLKKLMGDK